MGITGTIITVAAGAALIGGASGAAVYHYKQKRQQEEEYQQILNYKRQFQNLKLTKRRVICRYNKIN